MPLAAMLIDWNKYTEQATPRFTDGTQTTMGRRVMGRTAQGVLAVLAGMTAGVAAWGVNPVSSATPGAAPGGPPAAIAAQPTEWTTTGRGPEPPDQGVWLGAWVQPTTATPNGRAQALTAFDELVQGDLPIAHMFHEWTDAFPGPTQESFQGLGKLQMISWSGADTREITKGLHDDLIRQRAEAIRDYGVPLLLRWRWEMDRPNLQSQIHSPQDYISAWRRIRWIFTEVGARNAAFVWCPHVQGFTDPTRDAAAYYPGDGQVDWLCTDVYPGPTYERFGPQMDAFMEFASQRPRPVIIGEFGATHDGEAAGARGDWIRQVRRYVSGTPQIKAAVYFSAKQTSPAYDSTLDGDWDLIAAMRALTRDPHFQAAPPALDPPVVDPPVTDPPVVDPPVTEGG